MKNLAAEWDLQVHRVNPEEVVEVLMLALVHARAALVVSQLPEGVLEGQTEVSGMVVALCSFQVGFLVVILPLL